MEKDIIDLCTGHDANGKSYEGPESFWNDEIISGCGIKNWYKGSVDYWEKHDASLYGIMDGFTHLAKIDEAESNNFLKQIIDKRKMKEREDCMKNPTIALDGGCGIGRISKNILLSHFDKVDLVEPCKKHLDMALKSVSNDIAESYQTGLQDFYPEENRYSCIWLQWCLLYLEDDDLVAFLKRCRMALKEDGIFVIKENAARQGFHIDREDNSITRSDEYYRWLFKKAGFTVSKYALQKKWPQSLYRVYMYSLTKNI